MSMPGNAVPPAASLWILFLANNAGHAQFHPEVRRFAVGRATATAAVCTGLERRLLHEPPDLPVEAADYLQFLMPTLRTMPP